MAHPEIVSTILFPVRFKSRLTAEFEGRRTPAHHPPSQLLVSLVVDCELVSSQPAVATHHLGEDGGTESSVLLGSQLQQPVESKAPLQCHQVSEVAGLGSSKQRQDFVDSKLLEGEDAQTSVLFHGKETRVAPDVDLRPVVIPRHDETHKPGIVNNSLDAQSHISYCTLRRRSKTVHCGRFEAEEIEIPGDPVDVAPHDQCGTTCQGKAFRFVEVDDDPGDLLLKRAQHADSTARRRAIQSDQARLTYPGRTRSSKSSSSSSGST